MVINEFCGAAADPLVTISRNTLHFAKFASSWRFYDFVVYLYTQIQKRPKTQNLSDLGHI
jgi:hypothetical protein